MKIKRKRILAELSVEEIIKLDSTVTISGRVNLGDLAVGDCFNSLYKSRTILIGSNEDDFRVEIYNSRQVSLQIKSIKLWGKLIEKIYEGHSTEIELGGSGIGLLDPPYDTLAITTES